MSSLLNKFAPAPGSLSIACYHCGKRMDVGRSAQTVTCRNCHKPLQVSDVQVKRYDARRDIRTVGLITVEKKGQIVGDRVECGGLIARGQIKAKQPPIVRGVAMIGPKAQVNGGLSAYTVQVAEGAELDGYFCVGKDAMIAPPPPVDLTEPAAVEVAPDPAHVDAPAAIQPAAPPPRLTIKPPAAPLPGPTIQTPTRGKLPPPKRNSLPVPNWG